MNFSDDDDDDDNYWFFFLLVITNDNNNNQSYNRSSLSMNSWTLRSNYQSPPRKPALKTRHNSISKRRKIVIAFAFSFRAEEKKTKISDTKFWMTHLSIDLKSLDTVSNKVSPAVMKAYNLLELGKLLNEIV